MDDATLLREFGSMRDQIQGVGRDNSKRLERHEQQDQLRFDAIDEKLNQDREIIHRGLGSLSVLKWLIGILVAMMSGELGIHVVRAMSSH